MVKKKVNQRNFSGSMFQRTRIKIILIAAFFLLIPFLVGADELGQKTSFFVDKNYDLTGREKITAILQKITDQLYFYLDTQWWDALDREKQNEVSSALSLLAQEFEQKIYPILTQNFGSEWKPGIDGEQRITILIQPMVEEAGGYFNSGDEYPKLQIPTSNQREMFYLNSEHLTKSAAKSFLAHEFLHLITFNQKDKLRQVSEEVWLNEARSEIAVTLLGYDKEYQNSNLQRRVQIFLQNPRDSLTEWQGKTQDYGVLNLFSQYLLDHYGKEIFIDSLKSTKVGISSLDEALKKNGFRENFSQIFTDWLITLFINNCQGLPKYCYLNENLKNLRITPFIYFLPTAGESTLSIGYLTKEWSGLWQKIIGGKENLRLEFSGSPGTNFKVVYLVEDSAGNYSVNFLKLDQSQKGKILVDQKITSLIIIPSAQGKMTGFSNNEPSYQFFWTATTEKLEEEKIEELLAQIEFLKKEIARLQVLLAAKIGTGPIFCQKLENNLYYGIINNQEVRCLQEFLKTQGPEIYPEGLVTGNFLSLTQKAVIRFQERYKSEILAPLGLEKSTGFVGPATRAKLNEFLMK